MSYQESLYRQAVRRFSSEYPDSFDINPDLSQLPQEEQDFYFAMGCNGLFRHSSGEWISSAAAQEPFLQEFKGQNVAFFGPNVRPQPFFSGSHSSFRKQLSLAFEKPPVLKAIRKYRTVDEDQAARIAFLLGGTVCQSEYSRIVAKSTEKAEFLAKMAMLGEQKSGEALVSASAMYILSGGSTDENRDFMGEVYRMSEAIRRDDIVPVETRDLGLSQVARLRNFLDKGEYDFFPDNVDPNGSFNNFPTVGAEFHFSLDDADRFPNFWRRLALLNMSQYQRGSYVQFSRNDRGVIEVRMNPSIYPITVANWNHMRLLLPELDQAFFTLTLNRPGDNFNWHNSDDARLLNQLRALGLLTYAGLFKNVPDGSSQGEVGFGSVYLGQTVKIVDGEYNFSGNWGGGEGNFGQLGLYVGFGDNFPHLAYYLSMALANPYLLSAAHRKFWESIRTLPDALSTSQRVRRNVMIHLQDMINANKRLKQASDEGEQIVEYLRP